MIDDKKINETCIGVFRAAAASVVERSRDIGFTLHQYDELEEWLTALTTLFRNHKLELIHGQTPALKDRIKNL
jgi:hypothetical protein